METLSELKSMFTKFMNIHKESDSGSPTKSYSPVQQQSGATVRAIDSLLGSDSPIMKSGTCGKEKEKSPDNSIHSTYQEETPASLATCRKEGPTISNDISPVSEAGDLVDNFLDFDGAGGTEANAQLAATEALAEISSSKHDMEAEKTIQEVKVPTDAKDIAAPIQSPQSKVRHVHKGSLSNKESAEAEGGKEPEREPGANPYSMTPSPNIQRKRLSKSKEISGVS
jgi:hypothetical protein